MTTPAWLILIGMTAGAPAPETATTQPAATQPAQPSTLADLISALDDADPTLRHMAAGVLMERPPAELSALRDAVPPSLSPPAIQRLSNVVQHLYLRNAGYTASDSEGYLGLRLAQAQRAPDDKPALLVQERFAGFAFYPILREGDLIVAYCNQDHREPLRLETFVTDMQQLHPGALVTFNILRDGQELTIQAPLDPRPVTSDRTPQALEDFLQERAAAAEAFWQAEFAPALSNTGK